MTPGPAVSTARPGHPGQLAGGLGGEGRGLLVADVEEPHRRVGQHRAVVHREDVRPGQREHGLDAVRARDGDGELPAVALDGIGHGAHSCSRAGQGGCAAWRYCGLVARSASTRTSSRSGRTSGGLRAQRELQVQRPQERLGVAALEVRVAVVVRRARAGGGGEPGDPRLDDLHRDDVAPQHSHRGGGQPVGLAVAEQAVDLAWS